VTGLRTALKCLVSAFTLWLGYLPVYRRLEHVWNKGLRRHRYLNVAQNIYENRLEGIVAADDAYMTACSSVAQDAKAETYFKYQDKASANIGVEQT